MDDLTQRRQDRLKREYKASPDYVEPVFSSKVLFVMAVLCFWVVAIIAGVLL